jgi:hypothetical protein
MLLVLPFCQTDYKLAVSLAKYLQYLGPYKQHDLLLACPGNLSDQLDEIQSSIGDQFARVSTYTLKSNGAWPQGANNMFHSIAYHILTKIDCKCWYLYEPDCTPIKPGWLNTLASEYERTHRPFMGCVQPTYWKRKDGTFYQDGVNLAGSAIYPRDVSAYSSLFKSIPYTKHPWNVYWQWNISPNAVNTNLIHNEWRSFGYRRDKKSGEIVSERVDGTLPPELNTPIPLRPDAVTHHGCKDGSLMQILRGIFTAQKEPVEV